MTRKKTEEKNQNSFKRIVDFVFRFLIKSIMTLGLVFISFHSLFLSQAMLSLTQVVLSKGLIVTQKARVILNTNCQSQEIQKIFTFQVLFICWLVFFLVSKPFLALIKD